MTISNPERIFKPRKLFTNFLHPRIDVSMIQVFQTSMKYDHKKKHLRTYLHHSFLNLCYHHVLVFIVRAHRSWLLRNCCTSGWKSRLKFVPNAWKHLPDLFANFRFIFCQSCCFWILFLLVQFDRCWPWPLIVFRVHFCHQKIPL